jgi:hypothetical protein
MFWHVLASGLHCTFSSAGSGLAMGSPKKARATMIIKTNTHQSVEGGELVITIDKDGSTFIIMAREGREIIFIDTRYSHADADELATKLPFLIND